VALIIAFLMGGVTRALPARVSPRRAMEPVVALIILVGVAIAVALAFASWMLGFWSVHSTIHGQAIDIYEDSYYSAENHTLYLHLKTHIDPEAILWFEVTGAGNVTSINVVRVLSGDVQVVDEKVIAKVGSEFWIAIETSNTVPAGTMVYFKIYTEKGYVVWGNTISR
jgi:hypothetical protein